MGHHLWAPVSAHSHTVVGHLVHNPVHVKQEHSLMQFARNV